MSSSSILSNKYFNNLNVNRLQAREIKSDNIINDKISYLYSLNFASAKFERNSSGGTLIIDLYIEGNNDVIQFSDRPFRQTKKITLQEIVELFAINNNNSFKEDPPNGVLVHSEEQRTYIIKSVKLNDNIVNFDLELLSEETHNLEIIEGKFNLFIDDDDAAQIKDYQYYTVLYRLTFTLNLSNPVKAFVTYVGSDSDYNYYESYPKNESYLKIGLPIDGTSDGHYRDNSNIKVQLIGSDHYYINSYNTGGYAQQRRYETTDYIKSSIDISNIRIFYANNIYIPPDAENVIDSNWQWYSTVSDVYNNVISICLPIDTNIFNSSTPENPNTDALVYIDNGDQKLGEMYYIDKNNINLESGRYQDFPAYNFTFPQSRIFPSLNSNVVEITIFKNQFFHLYYNTNIN